MLAAYVVRPRAALALAATALALASPARAEDIDLFVGASSTAQNPNVLIVIDNSANWNAANQHWVGAAGESPFKQGQSELRALRALAGELDDKINFGLMMFTPGQGSFADGGYVRFHVRPMNVTNRSALQELIGTDVCIDKPNFLNGTPNCIFKNFSGAEQAATADADYSAALFEVFKYFGGYTSPAHAHDDVAGSPVDSLAGPLATHFGAVRYAGNPDPKTDAAAFSVPFNSYSSPIGPANTCGKNYVIFIGNGFPSQDMAASVLSNVQGDTTQLAMPVLSTSSQNVNTVIGASCGTGGNSGQRATNCTANIPQSLKDSFPADTYACVQASESVDTTLCPGASARKFDVQASKLVISVSPTGQTAVPPNNEARLPDEWTKFLYTTDVNAALGQQNVRTYAIDVFKDAQDARQSRLLFNMARVGGGRYFQATSEEAILSALRQILVEIQSVNSVFASASLPINATNRSQNENQVFIGMFRPDGSASPRWYGNLKRYQIGLFGAEAKLADRDGNEAVSNETGFIQPCATSFWTSDSGSYWNFSQGSAGLCTLVPSSVFSDAPDGANVEKGATAEVVRKGNAPPATDTTPTNVVARNLYTCSSPSTCKFGQAMDPFDTTTVSQAAIGAADAAEQAKLVDFVRGVDVNDDNINNSYGDVRPSVHGDVAHSRPLPINYGGTTGVVVYYGANDGTLRAVRGSDGQELWGFIAPEHLGKLRRLHDQSPLVLYPSMTAPFPVPMPTRKEYFFDGSSGLFQNADNSKIWIYPSMRRGGRMIYAFDVTNPQFPQMKWRAGCPNPANDTGCVAGFDNIGQTWSTPSVALAKGFHATDPLVVVGGGYDACEDADASSPACASPKGSSVYALNADTGVLVKTFGVGGTGTIDRSVAGDIAFLDRDFDGYVDQGYFADTGGGVYRIDFSDPATLAPLPPSSWALTKVAQTSGGGRKFLFAPAVLSAGGRVYVSLASGDRERPLIDNYPYQQQVQNRAYLFIDTFATSGLPLNLDDTALMDDLTTGSLCGQTISPNAHGWFFDLSAGRGEQAVTSTTIFGGLVFFSTNRPLSAGPNACASGLGEARGYAVNLLNASGAADTRAICGGARSGAFAGGGLPPSPVTGTVPVGPNGTPVTVMIGGVNRGGGVSTPIGAQRVTPAITQRRSRVYWYIDVDK
ncbi:MAG TPA: PilC/PilY family type IV pilus protein [Burkholderiales bacterium]|nr:PilC/PilY family type IV pilus protein [Burkholderiales bacterium]